MSYVTTLTSYVIEDKDKSDDDHDNDSDSDSDSDSGGAPVMTGRPLMIGGRWRMPVQRMSMPVKSQHKVVLHIINVLMSSVPICI